MLPLSGLRIIAVEQYGAGPFGSMLLGDLGAEVIKIENPAEGGDVSRSVGPAFLPRRRQPLLPGLQPQQEEPDAQPEASAGAARAAQAGAHGRRDLRQPARRSAGEARRHLRAAAGSSIPKIVCAHLSAYGREGPRKAWPGYDYLMQAEAGYLSRHGRAGRSAEPHGPFHRRPDDRAERRLRAGIRRAVGTRDGQGARHRRVPVRHRAAEPVLPRGLVPQRRCQPGTRASLQPSLAHPQPALSHAETASSSSCATRRSSGPSCAAASAGRSGARAPDYKDFKARLANRAQADGRARRRAVGASTTAEWIEIFGGRVPAAPVHDVRSALENPFVMDEGRVRTVEHPTGPIRLLAPPITCPGEETPCKAAPAWARIRTTSCARPASPRSRSPTCAEPARFDHSANQGLLQNVKPSSLRRQEEHQGADGLAYGNGNNRGRRTLSNMPILSQFNSAALNATI